MVKKKSVKKKSVRRKVKKRPVKKITRKTVKSKRMVRFSKKKINLVLKNLILFVILFTLSFVLYNVSSQEMYTNLFLLLSIIFGFITIAFLIVLLIFLFLKVAKK